MSAATEHSICLNPDVPASPSLTLAADERRPVSHPLPLRASQMREAFMEDKMLYYPDGAASFARYISVGISLAPDISRSEHSSVNRFSLHRQISSLIYKSALDGGGADKRMIYSADIFLTATFPGKEDAIRATARVDLSFDPVNFGADLERPVEMSPEQGLRQIIDNEMDRAWGFYRLDHYSEYVQESVLYRTYFRIVTGCPFAALINELYRSQPY